MIFLEGKAQYEKLTKLGQGGEGIVFLCRDLSNPNGPMLVMKHLLINKELKSQGMMVTILREIKLLKEIQHPNLISLKDVSVSTSSLGEIKIRLIYNYMMTDLGDIINDEKTLITEADVRCYMWQILKGVQCLHDNGVLHRDIKPENILISESGQVQISDFGNSKHYGISKYQAPYSPHRGTRWYRAPELLFGATQYGPPADMWSVGCLMAELMRGSPLFSSDSELNQLPVVIAIMGTPSEEDWPGVTAFPLYQHFKKQPPVPLESFFSSVFHGDALDLVSKLITMNPNKRLTCEEALAHDFFKGNTTKPSDLKFPEAVLKKHKARKRVLDR